MIVYGYIREILNVKAFLEETIEIIMTFYSKSSKSDPSLGRISRPENRPENIVYQVWEKLKHEHRPDA